MIQVVAKVNQFILIHKLKYSGILGYLLRFGYLLYRYIGNRLQTIFVNGFLSKFFKSTSGVPQGSHPEPLFFVVYVNSTSLKTSYKHNNILNPIFYRFLNKNQNHFWIKSSGFKNFFLRVVISIYFEILNFALRFNCSLPFL